MAGIAVMVLTIAVGYRFVSLPVTSVVQSRFPFANLLGEPTASSEDEETAEPRIAADPVEPSDTFAAHEDEFQRFTINYPENWYLYRPTSPQATTYITSYDLETAPGLDMYAPGQFKMDISFNPNPDKLKIEAWISSNDAKMLESTGEKPSVISSSSVQLGESDGWSRVVDTAFGPQRTLYFLNSADPTTIQLTTYLLDPKYDQTAAKMVDSLDFKK